MPFTCSFCKCSVHHPTCYIGDAGQAYETVNMETVVNATRSLIKEAGQKGLADGIQVKKCRSPEVSFGGSIRTAFLDRLVYTRATLAKFACTCLLFRTVRLACLFATQISGIPTGAPFSGVFLDMILCQRETRFDRTFWKRLASHCALRGDRRRYIVCRRYVDDLLSISYSFCDTCLVNIITTIYSGLIIFERDPEATISHGHNVRIKFLDFVVVVSHLETRLFQKVANFKFLVTGNEQFRQQVKIQPCLGPLSIDQLRAHTRNLSGRRARWSQLELAGPLCYIQPFLTSLSSREWVTPQAP